VYFAHYLGKALADFIEKHQITPDFVAVHGQTIFHQPEKNFTAQICDGETLVTYLNCPLVLNFRNKDIALGGQGAPLVPLGDKYLFADYRLFLNLGGIANISYQNIGFDIVPCNMVMNDWVRRFLPEKSYDEGGRIAASGNVIPSLLAALNALPYFSDLPPKSLGTEWVEKNVFPLFAIFQPSLEDGLRTYVQHIALQIAQSIEQLKIQDELLLLTGGGSHNDFLKENIQQLLLPSRIAIASESVNLIDFKEAIIFAFLGLRTLTGKPNTLPSVTGAKHAAVSGSIHLPIHSTKRWIG
jgi:anhydro-N-acetylmuramic acid kinase